MGACGDNTICDHVIDGFLYLVTVLYRCLPFGMLDWADEGVGMNGVIPRHVTYGVKRVGKCLPQGKNV